MPVRSSVHMTITEAHPYHRHMPDGVTVEIAFDPNCPRCREEAARNAGPTMLGVLMTAEPMVRSAASGAIPSDPNEWSTLHRLVRAAVRDASEPRVEHPKPRGPKAGFGPGEEPDLGVCCGCGRLEGVRNVGSLPFRSATPEQGWGCVRCGAEGGAVVVLCDECARERRVTTYCLGFPKENRRAPIPPEDKQVPVEHDPDLHPEIDPEVRQENDA